MGCPQSSSFSAWDFPFQTNHFGYPAIYGNPHNKDVWFHYVPVSKRPRHPLYGSSRQVPQYLANTGNRAPTMSTPLVHGEREDTRMGRMGVSMAMGVPQHRWFTRENRTKWMI